MKNPLHVPKVKVVPERILLQNVFCFVNTVLTSCSSYITMILLKRFNYMIFVLQNEFLFSEERTKAHLTN